MRRWILLGVLLAASWGCGGDQTDATRALQATLTKGPIDGAECVVRTLAGVEVGRGVSADGQLSIEAIPRDDVLVVTCTGGAYVDEVSGQSVDAADLTLRALIAPASGAPEVAAARIAITPFSELAVRLAAADDDYTDYDARMSEVAAAVGLPGVALTTLDPIALAGASEAPWDDGRRLTFALASFAAMSAELDVGVEGVDAALSALADELAATGELVGQAAALRRAIDRLADGEHALSAALGEAEIAAARASLPGADGPQDYALIGATLVGDGAATALRIEINVPSEAHTVEISLAAGGARTRAALAVDPTTAVYTLALDDVRDGQLVVALRRAEGATQGPWVSLRIGDDDRDGLSNLAERRTFLTDSDRPDTDGDGLLDGEEPELGLDPNVGDMDGDGLLDGAEVKRLGTDPRRADSDDDGLEDGAEVRELGMDPMRADSDDDGLSDAEETGLGTDPLRLDTDGDGVPDGTEATAGTSPLNSDSDGDGLDDGAEAAAGTDPLRADSDGDSIGDAQELRVHGTNPLAADTDGDSVNDALELAGGLDPKLDDRELDSDGDGLSNAQEQALGTSASNPDSDGDGAPDGEEVAAGTEPGAPDTDGDGLLDGEEATLGSSPFAADSDGDGLSDALEPLPGRDTDSDGLINILDADSDGDGIGDGAEPRPLDDLDGDGSVGVLDADADGDGIIDGEEIAAGLDPTDAADGPADPDADGLSNAAELRRGTALDAADTDADGYGDGAEVAAMLDPRDPIDVTQDADGDGLTSGAELDIGTDPHVPDSDGDGVVDGVEDEWMRALGLSAGQVVARPGSSACGIAADTLTIAAHLALIADADNDGVPDGSEPDPLADRNADGVRGLLQAVDRLDCLGDADVLAFALAADGGDGDADGLTDARERLELGTDPGRADTDGDGLSDGHEVLRGCEVSFDRLIVYPDPLNADTDNDGIDDGQECARLLDPRNADTDADGLPDSAELRLCTVDDSDCEVGALHQFSNPLYRSEDADGIPDGYDVDVKSADADGDGVSDDAEWHPGFDMSRRVFTPVGDADFVPAAFVLDEPSAALAYRVAVRIRPTDLGVPGSLSGLPGGDAAHVVHGNGVQWLSGPLLNLSADGSGERTIELTGSGVQVEAVALLGVLDGVFVPEALPQTFADELDSDADGVPDGRESRGVWWLEAEHHAVGATVLASSGAGNGQALQGAPNATLAEIAFDEAFTGEPAFTRVLYDEVSVFVRARRLAAWDAGAKLTLVASGAPGGDVEIDLLDAPEHYDWLFFGSFDFDGFGGPRTLRLVDRGVGDRVLIDQIAIARGPFAPRSDVVDYGALDPLRRVVPPHLTSYSVVQGVPFGFTHPLRADTDGDGNRERPGVLADSAGWLTDGRELALGLNPFSGDSDGDREFALLAGAAAVDEYDDIVVDGALLVGVGAPDGVPDYADASDPSPGYFDFDADGLPDELEIAFDLAHQQALCDATGVCGNVFDDVGDLLGVCGTDLGGGLPLCAYADDDWDDDGIGDGVEDADRDGVVDANETDPRSDDSDGDCIADGVEIGLDCPAAIDTLLRAELGGNCSGSYLTTAEGFRSTPGFLPAPPVELAVRTDPVRADTDGDGVTDGDRLVAGLAFAERDGASRPACEGFAWLPEEPGASSAVRGDTDGDGLDDLAERVDGTLPGDPDTDGDGLTDGAEVLLHETDPTLGDTDGDGLSDFAELLGDGPRTDPLLRDSDGDLIDDGDEVAGTGALASCRVREFCGQDGYASDAELDALGAFAVCPERACGFGRAGVCESVGCSFGTTDPLAADSDADGLSDEAELSGPVRSNPHVADTDGDGLSDRDEVLGLGRLAATGPTDPTRVDSDGDGVPDAMELDLNSSPSNYASRPQGFRLGGFGVRLNLEDWQSAAGVLTHVGRLELPVDAQASVAFDGTLTLTRSGSEFTLVGDGALLAIRPTGDLELWRGATRFSADGRAVTPAEGTQVARRFDMPGAHYAVELMPSAACAADSACTDDPGPVQVQLRDARIEHPHARVVVPAATTSAQLDPELRDSLLACASGGGRDCERASLVTQDQIIVFANVGFDLGKGRLAAEQSSWTGIAQPSDFTFDWQGRSCHVDNKPMPLGLEMFGELKLNPNVDLPDGTPPSADVPAASLQGPGTVNAPGLVGLGLVPPDTQLDYNPRLGRWEFRPDTQFEANIGELFGEPLLTLRTEPGGLCPPELATRRDECPCIVDVAGGRYSCRYSSAKKGPKRDAQGNVVRRNGRVVKETKYKYRGRLDISEHGLIPFQFDPDLDFENLTFRSGQPGEVAVSQDLDLCQDGQIRFSGAVIVPIKKVPLLALILEGDMVSDIVNFTSPVDALSDDDGLFTGVFGTVKFGIDRQTSGLSEHIDYGDFPLAVELGNAVAGMRFDDDGDLLYIAFDSKKGLRVNKTISNVPSALDELLNPEEGHARGIVDLENGRTEGTMTIKPNGLKIDANFAWTQTSDDQGQPTLGSIEVSGRGGLADSWLAQRFPPGTALAWSGAIDLVKPGYRIEGLASQSLNLPGLPGLPLADTRLTLTDAAVEVAGVMNLPGLGAVRLAGTLGADGSHALSGVTELAVHGMRVSSAAVAVSNGALSWNGVLHLPLLTGGGIVHVNVAGWYAGPENYGFSAAALGQQSIDRFLFPNLVVSGDASGVQLGGSVRLAGYPLIGVTGGINAQGGVYLTGGFNAWWGPINLVNTTLTLSRGGTESLVARGSGYVDLYWITGANTEFAIRPDGSFEHTANMAIAGQSIGMRFLRDANGVTTFIGATGVQVCDPILGRVCFGGRIVVENVGGLRTTLEVPALGLAVGMNGRCASVRFPVLGARTVCF
ncbi:MAG: hypothetical protein AAF515_14090 [Pseudomonadota bacterium]